MSEVPRVWRNTGEAVQLPSRVLDRVPPFDPRSGEHLWVWALAFRARPELLGDASHDVMLDAENLLLISGPGCYYCEQPYTPLLASRRCRGHG